MTASVTTTSDADTHIVVVRGELDLKTAPALSDALIRALDESPAGALADLSEVTFIDSTALAAFVAGRSHAHELGTSLDLVCPNADIRRVFEITGLDRVFRIHDERPSRSGTSIPERAAGSTTQGTPGTPAQGSTRSIKLAANEEAPAVARRFVDTNLADIPDEVQGDLLLLVSEVVTNAVRYGGAELELRLKPDSERVRVEVYDPAHGDLPDAPESVAVTAGRGRGLMIVDAISSAWGVTPLPDGKVVWFEVNRAS